MKIGILIKKDFTAVSHYRIAPWIVLGKYSNSQVFLIDPKTVTVYDLRALHVLIAHAPSTALEYQVLTQARGYGVRIIVDYDDLLHGLEAHNPALQYWGKEDVIERSTELLLGCDVLTVSTQELANQMLSRFGKESQVIPNALDDNAFKVWPELPSQATGVLSKKEKIKVLWRGSNTHSADLYTARAMFRDYAHIDWHFFGYDPKVELSNYYGGHLSQYTYIPGKPAFVDYMVKLLSIRPDVVIVPLENTVFNRCKSNIAWIEAIWAGAVCLAPDTMQEFRKPGVGQYAMNPDLFKAFTPDLLAEEQVQRIEAGRKYIEEHLLLSKVNVSRAEAIQLALEGRGA